MTIDLITRAHDHVGNTAIADQHGTYSYRRLLQDSARVAARLLGGRPDLEEARVAFLARPSFEYVAMQWGIWRAGGIAVPLAVMHPVREWEYVLDDTAPAALIVDREFTEKIEPLAKARSLPLHGCQDLGASEPGELPGLDGDRRAMILYTSGTTSRPKGVVTTHANNQAQVSTLISAWGWDEADRILNVLPLHHVHGIINLLSCALGAGACCEFLTPFDGRRVWQRIAAEDLTLFMAVPTIYSKLIAAWEVATPEEQRSWTAGAAALRLMVSGSAALPVSTLERWHEITGHVLLERYGMTEIGMALSNPLDGDRRGGHVGLPLPSIDVRRVDDSGRVVEGETPGEIEVRGPTVFLEYWNRPAETRDAFREGWFRTGDVALVHEGAFRILGRSSVDIIKTGGYKVSALEIEEVLRTHPQVNECAVVGIPDKEWGERVAACVVLAGEEPLRLEELSFWAKERLAPYKIPRQLSVTAALPRNAMGKVQKPAVVKLFASPPPADS